MNNNSTTTTNDLNDLFNVTDVYYSRYIDQINQAIKTLNEFKNVIIPLFDYIDITDHSGQGVVYKLIRQYFDSIIDKKMLYTTGKCNKGYYKNIINRRTNKKTLSPIRFKGWKGKR